MRPSLLIAGLGNPGAPYDRTRHNSGWHALDAVHRSLAAGSWRKVQKCSAAVAEATIDGVAVLLVKPLLFMNRSGEPLRSLLSFYKLPSTSLVVLCDDIDLPLGEVRYRTHGGPGTHNGLKSIVEAIGEEFPRIRIGLGQAPAGSDLATWVLSVPPENERKELEGSYERIDPLVRDIIATIAEHTA